MSRTLESAFILCAAPQYTMQRSGELPGGFVWLRRNSGKRSPLCVSTTAPYSVHQVNADGTVSRSSVGFLGNFHPLKFAFMGEGRTANLVIYAPELVDRMLPPNEMAVDVEECDTCGMIRASATGVALHKHRIPPHHAGHCTCPAAPDGFPVPGGTELTASGADRCEVRNDALLAAAAAARRPAAPTGECACTQRRLEPAVTARDEFSDTDVDRLHRAFTAAARRAKP